MTLAVRAIVEHFCFVKLLFLCPHQTQFLSVVKITGASAFIAIILKSLEGLFPWDWWLMQSSSSNFDPAVERHRRFFYNDETKVSQHL